MRKYLPLLALVFAVTELKSAAGYPESWAFYTTDAYLYDIQSGQNDGSMTETTFCNYLADLARTNIARTVRTDISDKAGLARQSVDGRTSMLYLSQTVFSTDVELNLVKTETVYDRKTGTAYAIAYIRKLEAKEFYRNKIVLAFGKLDRILSVAGNYASDGLVSKAREELAELKSELEDASSDLFMLNFFGAGKDELSDFSESIGRYAGAAAGIEAGLSQGIIICMEIKTSGTGISGFEKELKGILADKDCSFTDRPDEADWVVSAILKTREYGRPEMGGMSIYTVYADVALTMEKTTGVHRIVEDQLSVKGVHTMNYEEAERDACARLGKQLAERILLIISK